MDERTEKLKEDLHQELLEVKVSIGRGKVVCFY